jgi:hemolysin activation/secretion protein
MRPDIEEWMMNRTASRLALTPVCLLASAWAGAQVPDAGRALREASPAQPQAQRLPAEPAPLPLPVPAPSAAHVPIAPSAPQASFVLNAVSFAGNTRFSSSTLQALMADHLGRRVTLADLRMLADRVTALYRESDYILTRTVVPAQDVSSGRVEFSVLEGRLGQVRVERIEDVRVRDSVIEGMTARLPTDRPLTRRELERTILMLSDLPGMVAQTALESGAQPGTYDLVIELKAAPRVSFSADLDNEGSRSTGEYRIGASVRVNSPFRRGDNLDLRLFNSFGKGLNFGRIAYETPIGFAGWRTSAAYARVQYELGKDFAALDAHGSADVFELAATYPLLRSRTLNLFGKISLDYKQLRDHIGAVALVSDKHAQDLGLGLVHEQRDDLFGGGYTSANLTVYAGELDLRSPEDLAADQAPSGRHTDGRFVRAGYTVSRLQSLGARLSAYLALAGQWANRNLDSADRIAVGGARAVRAYSSASGIGDEAQILNAELRWSLTPNASLSAFYDIGRVRIDHRPDPAQAGNHGTLAGPGLGLYWAVADGAALRASLAWPKRGSSATAASQDERSPRAYAQLVKMF